MNVANFGANIEIKFEANNVFCLEFANFRATKRCPPRVLGGHWKGKGKAGRRLAMEERIEDLLSVVAATTEREDGEEGVEMLGVGDAGSEESQEF